MILVAFPFWLYRMSPFGGSSDFALSSVFSFHSKVFRPFAFCFPNCYPASRCDCLSASFVVFAIAFPLVPLREILHIAIRLFVVPPKGARGSEITNGIARGALVFARQKVNYTILPVCTSLVRGRMF